MMRAGEDPRLEMEALGFAVPRLEDLVDRRALREMTVSFEKLFGVPVRIFSASGALLVDTSAPPASAPRDGAGSELPTSAVIPTQPANNGVLYRAVPIEYDHHAIGRAILGPYVPPDAAPETNGPAESSRQRPPAADPQRVEELAAHLTTVLDVVLFSGHKALLTSKMHVASIAESYRELCDKNERLEEAYERLKELDRLKSNFLATVSHELRTPLTSILGYGEMLTEGIAGPLNEEQLDFVRTIRSKSQQLLGLIMSLLDLSKLESGTAAVRMGRTAIEVVIEEAVSTLAPAALKKGVALQVDAAHDLPLVLGDADRLRQVFINLIENAVKFTPPGGTVSAEARETLVQPVAEPGLVLVAPLRPVVEVRIVDTGVGIPEIERDRVFDPFYQVDQTSTREHGGAGLGLAIVKRLVDAHQGSIHVEANQPHGAVFVVRLPAARSASMAPPSTRGPLPAVFE
jgi:two-component system, NarL family, sensor histidine kinase BarA